MLRLVLPLLILSCSSAPTVDTAGGAVCATRTSGTATCSFCPSGQACLTDMACGPPVGPPDGGATTCQSGTPLEDRCHSACPCPSGQQCYKFSVFACDDTPRSIEVCCTAGSNCGRP